MQSFKSSTSSIALVAALASYAGAAAATAATPDATDVQAVIVTGTRTTGLKAVDSPAPIQVLDSGSLTRVGSPDLTQSLAANVPSFVAQAFGGDTANLTLSARLRGVSPNDTLVLVDGARRHGTANLAVLGGAFQGGAAPDLNFIPTVSIDHVEVLTDGAAAQYGTDAIAGVVNIILKRNSSGGVVNVSGGEYFDQGGKTADLSANAGFAPTANSFLSLSVESKFHGHSERGAVDPRIPGQTALFPSLVNAPGYPYLNRISGDAQIRTNVVSFNGGIDLDGGWSLYSFGSYGHKDGQSYENWRVPNKVFSSTTPKTYPYPFGFQPSEELREDDYSLTAGAKGRLAGWDVNLSTTYGADREQINVASSANAALYYDTGSTPNFFHNGNFNDSQWTNTLDLTHDFDVGLAKPLTVAVGAEYRHETYALLPGDPASYYSSATANAAGAQGATQSYPGFTPANSGRYSRDNEGAYVDLATSPVTNLQVDAALRFEHYSDFGDTTVGKLTARYDFTPQFALRGTVSTGFRAPTLAEEYYSATNVSPTSATLQLPPNSAAAKLVGLNGLKAEDSTNYSIGAVFKPIPKLTATIDAYQIEINKRIIGSGTVYGLGGPAGINSPAALATFTAVEGAFTSPKEGLAVFYNGADTRSTGVEFVTNYASDFQSLGRVDWTLSGAVSSTKVTRFLGSPTQLAPQTLLNPAALSYLQTLSPKYRILVGATWTLGDLSANLRETFYGKASEKDQGDDGVFYTTTIRATAITDLEVAYRVRSDVKLAVGASNLFNTYPDKYNAGLVASYRAAGDNSAVAQYPSFSPFGINGGYYYGRVTYTF